MALEDNNIKLEKYKATMSLLKVIFGTAIVGLTTALLNWSIQSKQVELQNIKLESELNRKTLLAEQEYLDKFSRDALQHDQLQRLRAAHYFSRLTTNVDLRRRWNVYYDEIKEDIYTSALHLRDSTQSLKSAYKRNNGNEIMGALAEFKLAYKTFYGVEPTLTDPDKL